MTPHPTLRYALATLVAGASVFASPLIHASPPEASSQVADERVLVRVVPGNEQILARLRAELNLLGLAPVRLDVAADAPTLGPDLLDELGPQAASAAIEIVIGDHRIDVWVADGNTGKALNRRLDLSLDPEQSDPRTVAIAAVELLRASRLELAGPEPDRSTTVEASERPPGQVRERERPPREVPPTLPSVAAVSLAPVVGGSPGGFAVTAHIELAARWAPLDRFALRFAAWIPTLGNRVDVTDGSTRLLIGMVFVEPQLLLPNKIKWLHPELGLGLGGSIAGFEGTATNGRRGVTRVYGGFAGHTHAGLGFAVAPRLWIHLDGYVGIVQPAPVVRSSLGELEAAWGLPFATGSFGLEIWL